MSKLKAALMSMSLLLNFSAFAESEIVETLYWVGDEDTANAVVRPLVNEYQRRYGVTIEVAVKSSTKGIRSVLMGQSDLGGTGRYTIEGLPEEMGVELHPIAWDALVAVLHPDNPLGNVSVDDLAKIISGEIKNWRRLGGADMPINLYLHDDPLAGVDYALLQILFGHLDVETGHAKSLADGVSGAQAVSQDPAGIAFLGLQSVKDSAVKVLMLNGIKADISTLKSGDYPLFRPLYLVVPPSHQNKRMIKDFVRYAESAVARSSIRQSGAMPYREAVNLVFKGMKMQRERMLH